MKYEEIKGDLIDLAKKGRFDVITHGCNCFCNMGAGIAPHMAKAFGCDTFIHEHSNFVGDINKLGQIDYEYRNIKCLRKSPSPTMEGYRSGYDFAVVNSYTQYGYGRNHPNHPNHSNRPLDYIALTMCLRKINHLFKGKHIGLPQIGCGLAGGDWTIVSKLIKQELQDCRVTVVIFNK